MSNLEIDAYLARHVPITQTMGIHTRSFEGNSIMLAAPPTGNTDDKGEAFSGTLGSVVFLSGWALTYMMLRERDVEADIAIVESKISYLQPVQDEIVAVCPLPDPDTVERFITTYRQRCKARWKLKAVIPTIQNPAVEFRGAMWLIDPVEDTPTEQPVGLYFPHPGKMRSWQFYTVRNARSGKKVQVTRHAHNDRPSIWRLTCAT